jgi:hypothetical protein
MQFIIATPIDPSSVNMIVRGNINLVNAGIYTTSMFNQGLGSLTLKNKHLKII